jgi:alpha-L-fucosidase 2
MAARHRSPWGPPSCSSWCIESSRTLGIDEDFRNELIAKRQRLAPTQISPDGRVMEWLEPYKEPEPQHRHMSHLWGLYPGDEISPMTTPQIAQAARKTLEVRGDAGVGWSLAFKAALWARLGDGNHAWAILRMALAPADGMAIRYDGGGGVYPNMFDASPPFQIDANFGVPAAIGEMLLQSQSGEIELLPALPDAWKNGKVTGLRARGAFQVDIAWQNGKLIAATIHSDAGEPCSVSYSGKTVDLKIEKGASVTINGRE